jgi:hypothetical protein
MMFLSCAMQGVFQRFKVLSGVMDPDGLNSQSLVGL